MRVLNDFQCEKCEMVHEGFMEAVVKTVPCAYCGAPAHRVITPVRAVLDGTDPDFPGAYLKWGRDRERSAKRSR